MPDTDTKPVLTAAKRVLIPFLEIVTYLLLGIVLFAALYMKVMIARLAPLEGITQQFSVWSVEALRNGLLAVTLLLSFLSLLVLPFRKKLIVLTGMILIAFLTRGLL